MLRQPVKISVPRYWFVPAIPFTARASRKGGAMSGPDRYQWRRDKDGLGVWEHRGKVAVAGVGHSPVDRRWDGVSMDQTLGAYSILACRKAMDEEDVTP